VNTVLCHADHLRFLLRHFSSFHSCSTYCLPRAWRCR
jgi:hypothetical protein